MNLALAVECRTDFQVVRLKDYSRLEVIMEQVNKLTLDKRLHCIMFTGHSVHYVILFLHLLPGGGECHSCDIDLI